MLPPDRASCFSRPATTASALFSREIVTNVALCRDHQETGREKAREQRTDDGNTIRNGLLMMLLTMVMHGWMDAAALIAMQRENFRIDG
jgi:hypothetical protein